MIKRRIINLLEICIILLILFGIYYFNNNDNIQFRQTEKEVVNIIDDSLKIYFMDVGEADSILIKCGNNMLIDAGNTTDGKYLVNYYKLLGISDFQYIIATHSHEDHIGGMANIVYNFNFDNLFIPKSKSPYKSYNNLLKALEYKNKSYYVPEIDSSYKLGDCSFQILYIGDDTIDLNNTSIVLKLKYKNTSYLFMGDATGDVEREILNKDIKSDVLKVGHHGSSYSTSAVFLSKVKPKFAIISVGKDNDYGHPKQITLDKLERVNANVYRTDQDGTIILSSDGDNIVIEKEKN